jgi:elongation factor P
MKDGPRPIHVALQAQNQQGVSNFMAIPATQMRPGMIIKHNDQLHLVFKVEHRTPGNLRAFIQAKLRNLRTGAMFEHRFRSADAIEKVVVDEVAMDFLYSDGDDYYFMNPVDYEQTVLKGSTLGDAIEYLTPNLQIKVSYHDGNAVGIELPATVELTVVETEPGLKSATASSVSKPAKMETGLMVQVPAFINEGEKIRVGLRAMAQRHQEPHRFPGNRRTSPPGIEDLARRSIPGRRILSGSICSGMRSQSVYCQENQIG